MEHNTSHSPSLDDVRSPSDEFITEEIARLDKKIAEIRAHRAFMKKVTTFPEEVQITWRDLYFVSSCHMLADMARALHKEQGIPDEALLEDIMSAIRTRMNENPSWVDEYIQIERDAALARLAANNYGDEEKENG
jgi:hypothetical protein